MKVPLAEYLPQTLSVPESRIFTQVCSLVTPHHNAIVESIHFFVERQGSLQYNFGAIHLHPFIVLMILPILPPRRPDDACVARPKYHPHPPVAIEFLNVTTSDFNGDDYDASLYLGVEHISYLTNNEVPFYRDMSRVSCNDMAIIVTDPGAQNSFPALLHYLLSKQMSNDSIMWLPHGRAFVIIDRVKFCDNICPVIFHTNRYEVFIESIKKYGFQQVRLDNGHLTEPLAAFYHEVR